MDSKHNPVIHGRSPVRLVVCIRLLTHLLTGMHPRESFRGWQKIRQNPCLSTHCKLSLETILGWYVVGPHILQNSALRGNQRRGKKQCENWGKKNEACRASPVKKWWIKFRKHWLKQESWGNSASLGEETKIWMERSNMLHSWRHAIQDWRLETHSKLSSVGRSQQTWQDCPLATYPLVNIQKTMGNHHV